MCCSITMTSCEHKLSSFANIAVDPAAFCMDPTFAHRAEEGIPVYTPTGTFQTCFVGNGYPSPKRCKLSRLFSI